MEDSVTLALSSTLVAGGASSAKSTTKGAIELGVGLDISLIGNLKLRGELRDFYTGEPDFNIRAPELHAQLLCWCWGGLEFLTESQLR